MCGGGNGRWRNSGGWGGWEEVDVGCQWVMAGKGGAAAAFSCPTSQP